MIGIPSGRTPTCLDLFCGTKSIANAFKKEGFLSYTVDLNEKFGVDWALDIMEWNYKALPKDMFDVIWASPPCQTYSLAAGSAGHREKDPDTGYNLPVSDFATQSDAMVRRAQEIIDYFQPRFWFFENPRAGMRNTEMMDGVNVQTIWYCQFGDMRAKPTDIFFKEWPQGMPRSKCHNYRYNKDHTVIDRHCHHEPSWRGQKTGTQGMSGSVERGRIPEIFCRRLAQTCMEALR